MPASSRLADLFGIGSPLRAAVPLMPSSVEDDGWQQIWANGMWGGYLTAAADVTYARMRVDLYWPGVRGAVVERIHADGSAYLVRGGDPATMCTGWARWDYECPLDQAVYYRATSTERAGSVVTTALITLGSQDRFWFKNIARPYLNIAVRVKDRGNRTLEDRRGILRPPLRPDPIVVNQIRQLDAGTIAMYCADQATETAIRALLADGDPVLLQYPGNAGGESLYLSIGPVAADPISRITVDLQRTIGLPFDQIGRPPGAAAGDPDSQYADLGESYSTYNQAAAAASSYLDLSMMSF